MVKLTSYTAHRLRGLSRFRASLIISSSFAGSLITRYAAAVGFTENTKESWEVSEPVRPYMMALMGDKLGRVIHCWFGRQSTTVGASFSSITIIRAVTNFILIRQYEFLNIFNDVDFDGWKMWASVVCCWNGKMSLNFFLFFDIPNRNYIYTAQRSWGMKRRIAKTS